MGKWDKTEQWNGSNAGSAYKVPGAKDSKHSRRQNLMSAFIEAGRRDVGVTFNTTDNPWLVDF